MWNRRQLLRESCVERDRPVKWSRSPIKLKAQYGRVYLTTPTTLALSLKRILGEDGSIQALCEETGGVRPGGQGVGEDVQVWPRRMFINPACDLLKYIRFFSAVKSYLTSKEKTNYYQERIAMDLYLHEEDIPIAGMYPEIWESEEVSAYIYRSE